MKTRKTITNRLAHIIGSGLLAAATITILGASAIAPAVADEGRHDRGEVREHQWRDHERFEHRRHVFVAPRFGYAVPGYYGYAPAPVYAVPSLNLGFTFR